jgi:hypothetical protein
MDSDRRDMAAAVVPSSTGSSHIAGVSNHILRLRCLESAEQVLSLSERPEKPLESDEREWWVLAAPGIVHWRVGRGRYR